MSENKECSHNCSSCQSNCSDRQSESLLEPAGEYNNIKHVVAVVSGKGGVGKSMVTSLLACAMQKKGYNVGVLDADITGPSIPKSFGVTQNAMQNELGILPAETKTGIKIMSVNMMLPEHDSPVIWRGPIIAGVVKQFWHDVVWGDLDYLFVDCPPGTGDVPLTVFQSLPLDGIIVVTSPQDLVSLIVKKAVNMAKMMNIPIIGAVENMSYFVCPDCKSKHRIFGGSENITDETGISLIGELPIDPSLAAMVDSGCVENADVSCLDTAVQAVENI